MERPESHQDQSSDWRARSVLSLDCRWNDIESSHRANPNCCPIETRELANVTHRHGANVELARRRKIEREILRALLDVLGAADERVPPIQNRFCLDGDAVRKARVR